MTEERFPRINLADVEDVEREVILHGLFYKGLNNKIAGRTGSGKTVLLTGLVLEALRSGEIPVHLDMEIGSAGTRSLYVAHGATDEELAAIHYLSFPAPERDEGADLAKTILEEGETFAVFDKKPDFLRSMALAENSNDDQSEFYGALIDPLREQVTTVVLAPTGHKGEFDKGMRARGGSESDYKYDAIWMLDVVEPFDRERIGRLALRCTKDRWGLIGEGRIVEFDIGGDGNGRILLTDAGSGFETRAESQSSQTEDFLLGEALRAGREIAADEGKPMKAFLDWFDEHVKRGSIQQRTLAVKRAAALAINQDRLVAVDTGRSRGPHKIWHYKFEAAG